MTTNYKDFLKKITDNNLNATDCKRQIVKNMLREHLDFHIGQLRDYMSVPCLKKTRQASCS